MILLLQGASDVARAAIAGTLAKEQQHWKHIPLEILYEVTQKYGLDLEGNEQVLTRVACHTAKELAGQRFTIVLSSPDDSGILSVMRDEFGSELIAIHLGAGEGSKQDGTDFDYAVDTATLSVNDVCSEILSFLERKPS